MALHKARMREFFPLKYSAFGSRTLLTTQQGSKFGSGLLYCIVAGYLVFAKLMMNPICYAFYDPSVHQYRHCIEHLLFYLSPR